MPYNDKQIEEEISDSRLCNRRRIVLSRLSATVQVSLIAPLRRVEVITPSLTDVGQIYVTDSTQYVWMQFPQVPNYRPVPDTPQLTELRPLAEPGIIAGERA